MHKLYIKLSALIIAMLCAATASAVNSVDYPDKIAVGLDRGQKILLDGQWSFQTDPKDIGEKEGWAEGGKIKQRKINVPLPWELAAPDLLHYYGVAWYEKEIDIPADYADKRIAVGFYGVGHHAKVFMNGKLAGEHTGLHAPFVLDVTELAKPGAKNTITIRVFDPLTGTSIYMDSHSLLKVSGIFRSVWLEASGKTFISDLFMMPDIDNSRVTARTTVCIPPNSPQQNLMLLVQVTDFHGSKFLQGGNVSVEQSSTHTFKTVDLPIKIPNPTLWDLEHPHLYKVEASLKVNNDEPFDIVKDEFGMRKIEAKNGRFYLNNKIFYLVGGGIDPLPYGGSGDVNWFLPGPYKNPTPEEDADDIKKIKSLGVNMIRIPLRMMHPQYLRMCDKLGLLVWQEASWTKFSNLKGWQDTWSECLLRDRNRPSAIIWTLFNESWGYEFADPIYTLVKKLDPTRLALDNTGGLILCQPNYPGNHKLTDIEDIHNYPAFNAFSRDYWLSLRRANLDHPLMISEFGPIPYMFNLGKMREKWGGKDAWWINTGRASMADPSKDSLPVVWNHMGFEQRYKDWCMDELYGGWDKFTAAHDWYYFWGLKSQTQWMRMNPEISGFLPWIWDNGQHGTGVIDNFKEVKVCGPEIAKIWTQDTVIIDKQRHNFWSGERVVANLYISHFSPADLTGSRIEWSVEGTDVKGDAACSSLQQGEARLVGDIQFPAPDVTKSTQSKIQARLVGADGKLICENWEPIWFYPAAEHKPSHISFATPDLKSIDGLRLLGYEMTELKEDSKLLITRNMNKKFEEFIKQGGTAIYFPASTSDLLSRNNLSIGSSALGGHTDCFYARHGTGVFDRIPFENPYIWQFRAIWPTVVLDGVRPVDHNDVLSGGYCNLLNHPCATTMQFRYGKGRVIVCTLNLVNAVHDDPAAVLILNDLIQYASGDFQPKAELGRLVVEDDFAGGKGTWSGTASMPAAGKAPNNIPPMWRSNQNAGVTPNSYESGRLSMPMQGPFKQYIDTTLAGGLPQDRPIALICSFTMPEEAASETVQLIGFTKDFNWGKGTPDSVAVFKLKADGHKILFSTSPWDDKGDVDTGQTYAPGKPQTLAIVAGSSGKPVHLYYKNSIVQAGQWKEITPKASGDALKLSSDLATFGVNCQAGSGGNFLVDYIGVIDRADLLELMH